MNEKIKCPYVGKANQILLDVFCRDCDAYHPQWKFPCVCEGGRIPAEPLGYKLCDKCNGRGYLND